MKDIIEDTRLSNSVLKEQRKTSSSIESQFPAIYRENGRELIELVKSYYRFLEEDDRQSTYNIRRIYDYRNIDSTIERMLLFFKNKFLDGLFFEEDIRFIVKNILDLYRRKGSKEGIELFFKLFFDEDVSTYFPSQDMFKPSTSRWQVGTYIQLYAILNINSLALPINSEIFGNKSNASGTVDNIIFIPINNSFVPIIFLDNVKGEFTRFDEIYTLDPLIFHGRVYGSLRSVSVDVTGPGTGDNKVGDIVEIKSSTGFGAKGTITSVSDQSSNEINFLIEDGNYGYTTTNTDILVSDQSIFFDGNGAGSTFIVNETVKQSKANTEVFGLVLGTKSNSIGVFLDYSNLEEQILFLVTDGNEFNPNEEIVQVNSYGIEVFGTVEFEDEGFIVVSLDKTKPDAAGTRYFFEKDRPIETIGRVEELQKTVVDVEDDYFFEAGFNIETVERSINISKEPLFVTAVNNTARADIGTITNTETINIITDIIGDFLDVPLNSNNYSEVPPALDEMSGTKVNGVIPTIETPLNEAFVPISFTIGEIATLSNVDPGSNHVADVFILARENLISRFNIKDQIIAIDSLPVGVPPFIQGDIISQTRSVQVFGGNTEIVEVRGEVKEVASSTQVTVKLRSFNKFIEEEPIFKQGSLTPISVNFIQNDPTSVPLGLNAEISGTVEQIFGKILSIDVFDSGFGYEQDSSVDLINITRSSNTEIIDAVGIASVTRQGITEGRWRTFESHINQEKVIQDSFFYQDYSYQITTGLNASFYETVYRNTVHPAGLKLFTQLGKTDIININVGVLEETIETFNEIVIDSDEVFQANNQFIYLL